jgi:RNA polymerase sigma-70 factor (ECF subfamily)
MEGEVPSPDLFLAKRAAAGHEGAWAELIDRHGPRLFNLALQFSRSREEAEDLTQEIFMRLYLNLKSYRGEVPLIGWALRLSRNLCIDHYRRTRRERAWRRVASEVLDRLPSTDDVEADSQRRLRLEAVYEGLAGLEEAQAEAILLCDLQGVSLLEASTYLEVPIGTLKSRLHRGRQRLTEQVQARLTQPATEPKRLKGDSGGSLPW